MKWCLVLSAMSKTNHIARYQLLSPPQPPFTRVIHYLLGTFPQGPDSLENILTGEERQKYIYKTTESQKLNQRANVQTEKYPAAPECWYSVSHELRGKFWQCWIFFIQREFNSLCDWPPACKYVNACMKRSQSDLTAEIGLVQLILQSTYNQSQSWGKSYHGPSPVLQEVENPRVTEQVDGSAWTLLCPIFVAGARSCRVGPSLSFWVSPRKAK